MNAIQTISKSLTGLQTLPSKTDKNNTPLPSPYMAQYFNNMALCLVQMKKYETALIYFERAFDAAAQPFSKKSSTQMHLMQQYQRRQMGKVCFNIALSLVENGKVEVAVDYWKTPKTTPTPFVMFFR